MAIGVGQPGLDVGRGLPRGSPPQHGLRELLLRVGFLG